MPTPQEPALPSAVRQLLQLVEAGGVSEKDLIAAARSRFPGQHPRRIAELLGTALTAGALTRDKDGRLCLPESAAAPEPLPAAEEHGTSAPADRPLRAVAVDLESLVRTTAVAPFTDKRIFQVGAVRFGTDVDWVAAQPVFSAYLTLPDDTWLIRSDTVRAVHAREAVAPAQALLGLHSFCRGAEVVVTYNGTEADFPLLAQAYEREQLPTLDPSSVDAYYLALAVWPDAPTHRLALLADHLTIDRSDLGWHNAVDDCQLLIRLLHGAAEAFGRWDAPLRDLITSACPDSHAWAVLRHLAGRRAALPFGQLLGEVSEHTQAEVDVVLSTHLTGRTPRRAGNGVAPGLDPVVVGTGLRGADGRVDAGKLAAVAHGGNARPRAAQQQMTSTLHSWADGSIGGLIEAPTGTGKSFAVLAAALDWLEADQRHRAIITTFTKQLQQQLADDVAVLASAVPGLLEASDVVKGQTNRLSMRALTVVLADATTALGRGRARPGAPNRFLSHPCSARPSCSCYSACLPRTPSAAGGSHARSIPLIALPFFSATPVPRSVFGSSRSHRQATVSTPRKLQHLRLRTRTRFERRCPPTDCSWPTTRFCSPTSTTSGLLALRPCSSSTRHTSWKMQRRRLSRQRLTTARSRTCSRSSTSGHAMRGPAVSATRFVTLSRT